MSRKVYIHCEGELGSRYNSLLGGITLARALQVEYSVHWILDDYCAAHPDDLFQTKLQTCTALPTEVIPISNIFLSDRTIDPITATSVVELLQQLTLTTQDILYSTAELPAWVMNTGIYEIMHGPLEFSKTIQNSSACYIEQYKLPKKFYGLYLAQPNSITLTERDFFYNLIQHNNKNVFFVCSEKLLAEKDFATLPNVFIRPKSWWINTDAHRTAMHDVDAAIDLHILSRSEILNTNKSSAFLQLAVILAGHNNYVRDAVLPELRLGLKVVDFTSTPQ